jgi:hypothetical protein
LVKLNWPLTCLGLRLLQVAKCLAPIYTSAARWVPLRINVAILSIYNIAILPKLGLGNLTPEAGSVAEAHTNHYVYSGRV